MRYLIRKHGLKVKAHILNDKDTECGMLLSNGMIPDNFMVYPDTQGKKICLMCLNNYHKKLSEKRKMDSKRLVISGSVANLHNSIPAKKPKNNKKLSKKHKKRSKYKDFYKSKEWRDLRYRALKLYGRLCMCCGRKPPDVALHVDHIIPRSKAPELELEITNLQILCEDCNLGKSNKDSIDYRITDDELYDLELLKKIPERF